MDKMSDVELLLILGFYYVGKEKNVEKFTTLFNLYFGRDLSVQTILYEVSRFRNVNPANNVIGLINDSRHQMIWNEYIIKDKVAELKELYNSFKSKEFPELLGTANERTQKKIEPVADYVAKDEPKELNSLTDNTTVEYKRNRSVVENALYVAGYKCEAECNCELFLRKDGTEYYTEGHHLIPLKFQSSFNYSLDVEANVVSLCPRCHRLLHCGCDKESLLGTLYKKRENRLRACGIAITYEKLLLLYSAMG